MANLMRNLKRITIFIVYSSNNRPLYVLFSEIYR